MDYICKVGEGTDEKKPKRVSIPKNFEPDEIGLNTAIQLLSLPRKLGFHPENNFNSKCWYRNVWSIRSP